MALNHVNLEQNLMCFQSVNNGGFGHRQPTSGSENSMNNSDIPTNNAKRNCTRWAPDPVVNGFFFIPANGLVNG